LNRQLLVTGAAAVRLGNLRARRYLDPYLAAEQTVSGAAEVLGVSIATMWHQTRALLDVGLIAEVSKVPRAGRPVRWYRAVADEFEIPLSELAKDSLETFIDHADAVPARALRDGLIDAMVERRLPPDQIVLRYRLLDNGLTDFSPGLRGGGDLMQPGAVWASWTTLLLTSEEAGELRTELEALWTRWTLRRLAAGTQRSPHTLRLAVAPTPRPRRAFR
jgi:hypothetical protein